jgi:hypothetical protein
LTAHEDDRLKAMTARDPNGALGLDNVAASSEERLERPGNRGL